MSHPSRRVSRPGGAARLRLAQLAATALFLIPVEAAMAGVVATGTFQSKESGLVAAGAFEVHEDGGAYSLMVKGDFKVSEGPDLYFAFHPQGAAAVTGGNAKTGAFRVDPMLRSLNGAQTYAIPAGFDPTRYRSLIIHCWKFNHLYAAGELMKAGPTSLEGAPFPGIGKAAGGKRSGGAVVFGPAEAGGKVDAAGRIRVSGERRSRVGP